MRASLRWRNLLLAGLVLTPATALAQSSPDPATSGTPATDAVGPQELQNFSLSGRVSKPADQQSGPAPVTTAPAPSGPADTRSVAPQHVSRVAEQHPRSASKPSTAPAGPIAKVNSVGVPSGSLTPQVNNPVAQTSAAPAFAPSVQAPAASTSAPPSAPVTLAPEHKLLLWPWLLAAIALAGASLLLLRRRRHAEAFAGPAHFDQFVPPEPAPLRPQPRPVPKTAGPLPAPPPRTPAPKGSSPSSGGIVSSRLRPALELAVRPLRCMVEDERVVLEFELELFNSGAAPARAVLAEASLFNAGINQDQELASFFANPVGTGEPLDVIPPMKHVAFINQVVTPRGAIQEYELGGRKVFVPILAFTALYSWSGGKAQTSAAYLVGRDTTGDKLGPLSLERGPREISMLAARPLPNVLRV